MKKYFLLFIFFAYGLFAFSQAKKNPAKHNQGVEIDENLVYKNAPLKTGNVSHLLTIDGDTIKKTEVEYASDTTTDGFVTNINVTGNETKTITLLRNGLSPLVTSFTDNDGGTGTGTGVTDHGALTGLDDDDHLQYFNIPRGDARYFNLLTSNLSQAADPTTQLTLGTKRTIGAFSYGSYTRIDASGNAEWINSKNSTEGILKLGSNGQLTAERLRVNLLSGAGNRMVIAGASGDLGTAPLPYNNFPTGINFTGTTTKTATITRDGLSDISATFTDIHATSLAVTGNETKTITINRNGATPLTATFTDNSGGAASLWTIESFTPVVKSGSTTIPLSGAQISFRHNTNYWNIAFSTTLNYAGSGSLTVTLPYNGAAINQIIPVSLEGATTPYDSVYGLVTTNNGTISIMMVNNGVVSNYNGGVSNGRLIISGHLFLSNN